MTNKDFTINNKTTTMVFIPAFKMSDVVDGGESCLHPAFIVNGKPIDGFYVSKYQCSLEDGLAISKPLADPTQGVDYDQANSACLALGKGWSLITALEWGAIALWCNKNGTLPLGNNDFGKDYRESQVLATPSDNHGDRISRVLTGSGPLSWTHDGTAEGVYDLNGNIWEWNAGLRLVYGEVQIAEPGQFAPSDKWMAISASSGQLITPNGLGTTPSSVKLDFVDQKWIFSSAATLNPQIQKCLFSLLDCDETVCHKARSLLLALGLLPVFDTEDLLFYACNGASEVVCFRGGKWSLGSNSGLFKTCLDDPRTLKASIGIRATARNI